ncbi:MAG TPA: hypothetical protein VNQ76_06510 [Planctomicrobium sp.]|nr:hypothetical protein [Planctomicrobium sp.]
MSRKLLFRRYSRVLQRLGIGSVAFGIVAALTRAWATYWLGPDYVLKGDPVPVQTVVAAAIPTTVDELLKTSPISLADWQTRVEQTGRTPEQRERQFREYLGREVIWEGFVDQINPLPEGHKEGPGSILIMHESHAALHSQAILGPPSVRCWCPPETTQKLKNLSRGQWIVIRGELKSNIMLGTALGTDLSNCELITAGEIRNVQTALDASHSTVVR